MLCQVQAGMWQVFRAPPWLRLSPRERSRPWTPFPPLHEALVANGVAAFDELGCKHAGDGWMSIKSIGPIPRGTLMM
jgi:hypothetical protein